MAKAKFYVVLDNVRSRENVGSIFRTADAAGVSKIYLCGITPPPPHPKISKTALGAEKWIPWEYHKQTWRLLEKLKKDRINIVALESAVREYPVRSFSRAPAASSESAHPVRGREGSQRASASNGARRTLPHEINIFKFRPKFPIVLIVGNEVKGLSPKILSYSDNKVFIPMHGKKESLNVAVAFGIAIYALTP